MDCHLFPLAAFYYCNTREGGLRGFFQWWIFVVVCFSAIGHNALGIALTGRSVINIIDLLIGQILNPDSDHRSNLPLIHVMMWMVKNNQFWRLLRIPNCPKSSLTIFLARKLVDWWLLHYLPHVLDPSVIHDTIRWVWVLTDELKARVPASLPRSEPSYSLSLNWMNWNHFL